MAELIAHWKVPEIQVELDGSDIRHRLMAI
jgi:hypothetical protein